MESLYAKEPRTRPPCVTQLTVEEINLQQVGVLTFQPQSHTHISPERCHTKESPQTHP